MKNNITDYRKFNVIEPHTADVFWNLFPTLQGNCCFKVSLTFLHVFLHCTINKSAYDSLALLKCILSTSYYVYCQSFGF